MIAEVSGRPTYMTLENTRYRILTTADLLFLFTIELPAMLKFQFALSAI
jgi:hypothetical protein